MQSVNFVASVDNRHRSQLDEIVHDLKEKGFFIRKVRKLTGTISGSANNASMIKRVQIPGLKIEEERINYALFVDNEIQG